MEMAASVVTYTVPAENAEELVNRVREYVVPAARDVPGYLGFLLLDQGEDRRMAILLFESVEHARAAQGTLTPVGAEHTYALMSGPAIGALGRAIVSDGLFAAG